MKAIKISGVCLSLFFLCLTGEAAWTTKRLTYNSGASCNPHVAANGSDIYMVWSDDTPGNGEIYFRKSVNGGVTWQSANKLTNTTGASNWADIAVYGANVYVVWADNSIWWYDIFLKKSANRGSDWQSTMYLTKNDGSSLYPTVAVNDTKIYITYQDDAPGNNEIFLKYSPLL